jgi:tRNA threonylcarbamoyladenosine biosynthesis protein TsaE
VKYKITYHPGNTLLRKRQSFNHGCKSCEYLCDVDLIFTKEQLRTAVRQFLQITGDARVFAFHGEIGAGKTTFIHAVCEAKGVQEAVSSPTFSIINEYLYDCDGTKRVLFHIDLYRLKDEAEAIEAGVEDCLYSGHICFAEWPEKAPGIFPPDAIHVHLSVIDSQTRQLSIGIK